jgi:hypothetical protein
MEIVIFKNKEELERLEGIINKNLQSFYELGNALREIRDKRLYRDVLGFDTFEEYCKMKWGMGRNYINRYISSSDVVNNLVTMGTRPTNERQARPLTRLEPEQQIEAWRKVVEIAPEGKITAALVTRVVKQIEKKYEPVGETQMDKKEYPYSDADDFVTIAISQLERIRHDDPLKKQALDRLKKWVTTFERKRK